MKPSPDLSSGITSLEINFIEMDDESHVPTYVHQKGHWKDMGSVGGNQAGMRGRLFLMWQSLLAGHNMI
jgi:hypothetical protein